MPDNHTENNSQIAPGSWVVGYLRDSGGPGQELSVEQQAEKLGQFCVDNNLVLTRLFQDAARSGGSVVGRRSFLEMLDYMEGGAQERAVIIWSYSRFSRDYDDTLYHVTRLRKAGKLVISITDTIPDTLDGRILESITAWKNAKFREDLSRDVRRGLWHVVAHYKVWKGGPVPIGYRLEPVDLNRKDGRVNHRLVPDEDTAYLVRRVFEMRAEGATYEEIQAAVGVLHSLTAVGRVLYNSIYLGEFLFSGDLIEDYCEPLVDRDLWERAQQVNRERGGGTGIGHPRTVRSSFILTGLIYCLACGERMHGKTTYNWVKQEYNYYQCANQAAYVGRPDWVQCTAPLIPQAMIEGEVLRLCKDYILRPEVIDELAGVIRDTQQAEQEKRGEEAASMRSRLAGVSVSIAHIVSAIAETGHSTAMLSELSGLERRKAEMEAEIARLSSPAPVYGRLVDIPALAREIGEKLGSDDPVFQKRALQAFIVRITAGRTENKVEGDVVFYLPGLPEAQGTVSLR